MAKKSSHLALNYPDPRALQVNHRVTGEFLVTDYLKCLRKHSLEILKEGLCDNVLETTLVEFIITVPAIWSEAAKQKTRLSAERAGMGAAVKLISEPEAAIIYALDQELSKLEIGDIVVVCDAGGGTVDLISYLAEQIKPMLQISEAAPGAGYACGSNFLNRIFRKMLEDKFSHLPDWANDTLEAAVKYFEKTVKGSFDGDNEAFRVPLPGLPDDKDRGIKRGYWCMSTNEVRAIFDPIIAIIIEYVQMQISISERKGTVKIVYLVGGFGESPYLRKSLRKVIREGIELIAPVNGRTAVARGALIKGLADASPLTATVNVKSRVARKAYGCKIKTTFRAGVHQHDRKYAVRLLINEARD